MDLDILLWIQTLRNEFLDGFFTLYTHLGDAGIIWILILGYLTYRKETRWIGIFGFVVMLADVLIVNGLLKPLINRPRPFQVYDLSPLISPPIGSSFPSGHAASSFAVAVYLYCWDIKYKNVYIWMAVVMAISRLYVFVHYPSDVLVGALVGSLIGFGIYKLSQKYVKEKSAL